MNNKPVGYSHLHDFIATATTEQLRARLFKIADDRVDYVEKLREKDEKILELEAKLQRFYTEGVIQIADMRVKVNREEQPVFRKSIYEGLFRIMRKQLMTRSATSTDCQWLASSMAQHVYRTLEKFNLVAKEK